MKLRQMIPQRKLKASTAATRRSNASTRAAYAVEEEEEPTMRLSTAFVVVVLLHIVAIGGIYTFEAVKVKGGKKGAETAELAGTGTKADNVASATQAAISPAAALAAVGPTDQSRNEIAPAAAVEKVAPKAAAASSTASAKTAAPAPGIKASGDVHTVVKGENPVVIAKKYGVDYDDLLTLNNIEDPRRLRIGQKLKIPTKP